jgi:signal peptidase I
MAKDDKSKTKEQTKEKTKSKAKEYIESIIIAILIAVFIRTFIICAYKIPSRSMVQTLLVGDHILVNKFIYGVKMPLLRNTIIPVTNPQRGDIVVFIYPNDRSKDFIKRVIGVGGDTIEIKNKKIFISGKEYSDSYGIYSDNVIYPATMQPRDNFGPITVPKDSIFVMGDNRDESLDSRFWGFVNLKDVEGKAFIIYWSRNHEAKNYREWIRWQRLGNLLH